MEPEVSVPILSQLHPVPATPSNFLKIRRTSTSALSKLRNPGHENTKVTCHNGDKTERYISHASQKQLFQILASLLS
jgi:hypothetical protein